MSLSLLLLAVFIPQEFISAGAVLLLARQAQYPFWIIHLIWLSTTIFDMYIGYALGGLIRKRFRGTKFIARTDRWAERVGGALGKYGQRLSLTVLGFVNFPYLNTFFASWLKLPMRTAFIFTFIGNLAWYLALLATIFGAAALIPDQRVIFLALIIAGIASNILFRFYRKRRR